MAKEEFRHISAHMMSLDMVRFYRVHKEFLDPDDSFDWNSGLKGFLLNKWSPPMMEAHFDEALEISSKSLGFVIKPSDAQAAVAA